MNEMPFVEFAAAVNAAKGSDRAVFIHYMNENGARWHFGECFPDVDVCTVPTGADLDEQTN